ncbi:leucine-rich repeat serine/threonine-protein kinase 1-like [Sphaeramia orbicularis]|uniref:leucine-rich repeat serine/threonine-protein kinase 1-like n=1 Tax=Sphaeramia orbicularis TaxID=375764 RepID=UPI00117F51E9|nr:leucine-rich repeat serine/threonine-protein kinase 1-like [Sphaeramia orbicularis]
MQRRDATHQCVRLLYMASQHGDLQSVTYLLKEAHVAVPHEPSNGNPAIVAAYYGHTSLVKELLDSIPGPCLSRDLLNWMLATSCQQGHMDVVRLLVHNYDADAKDCGSHSEEFAVITGLPLYAAAQAGENGNNARLHDWSSHKHIINNQSNLT